MNTSQDCGTHHGHDTCTPDCSELALQVQEAHASPVKCKCFHATEQWADCPKFGHSEMCAGTICDKCHEFNYLDCETEMSKEQEMPTALESLKAQNELDEQEVDEAEPAKLTREQMLESVPNYCKEVAALLQWSDNHNHPTPYSLFLDLIGWSDENFGERIVANTSNVSLGYVEIGYLADALQEYATRPHDVSEWIDQMISCEQ